MPYKDYKESKIIVKLAKLEKEEINKLIEKFSSNLIILDEENSTNNLVNSVKIFNKLSLIEKYKL